MGRTEILKIGLAGLFIAAIYAVLSQRVEMGGGGSLLVIAAMIGGYMALNIGANDVANNVGPAVGSGALTLLVWRKKRRNGLTIMHLPASDNRPY